MADDQLLKEIQGGTTKVEIIRGVPEKAQGDPLDTAPKGPVSAVAAMDAKHSTVAGGKGYRVEVVGEYRAPAPGLPSKTCIKKFAITVNLPSLDSALSVLRNKLLPKLLPIKYKDYKSLRTQEIIKAEPLSPSVPESKHLQFMSRDALMGYARENRVPIDLSDAGYDDVTALRTAVIDYTLNPKGFEHREATRVKERAEMAELEKLNPELTKSPEDLPEEKETGLHTGDEADHTPDGKPTLPHQASADALEMGIDPLAPPAQ